MQYKTWGNGVLSGYKACRQVQKHANGEKNMTHHNVSFIMLKMIVKHDLFQKRNTPQFAC
jgi:hypothetical protein